MYKRYYDSYNKSGTRQTGGEIVVPERLSTSQAEVKPQVSECASDDIEISGFGTKSPLKNLPFELDDLILIGILLFLLFDKDNNKKDDNNDIFMLIIIGLVICSDIF